MKNGFRRLGHWAKQIASGARSAIGRAPDTAEEENARSGAIRAAQERWLAASQWASMSRSEKRKAIALHTRKGKPRAKTRSKRVNGTKKRA